MARASLSLSAFFFAGKYLSRISAPAFPNAGLAGFELPGCDQAAGVIGSAAVCILAALVAELVVRSAGLRGIWPACKVKAMTTGEPTRGR